MLAHSSGIPPLLPPLEKEFRLLQEPLLLIPESILAFLLGTPILSVTNCVIVSTKFQGAGGYTITTKAGNLQISYCHVSPNFIVSPNQVIAKGQPLSNVGPFNVYGVPNNPYKDRNGRPTNGATTGPHLHITIKNTGIIKQETIQITHNARLP